MPKNLISEITKAMKSDNLSVNQSTPDNKSLDAPKQQKQKNLIPEKKNSRIHELKKATLTTSKKKVKVNFFVDSTLIEKLKICAVKRNIRYSKLLEEALNEYLIAL